MSLIFAAHQLQRNKWQWQTSDAQDTGALFCSMTEADSPWTLDFVSALGAINNIINTLFIIFWCLMTCSQHPVWWPDVVNFEKVMVPCCSHTQPILWINLMWWILKRSWYHAAVILNQSSESTRLSLPGEIVQGPPRAGRLLDSLCCSSLCCKRRHRQKCYSRLCRSSHHLSVAGCMFCWLPQASPSWLRSKSNGNWLEPL